MRNRPKGKCGSCRSYKPNGAPGITGHCRHPGPKISDRTRYFNNCACVHYEYAPGANNKKGRIY